MRGTTPHQLGIDAGYELWDRPPIELADAIAELRGDGFLGANVTIPHKERVVPIVDRLTEEAHATGAGNTITKEGRKLVGHNTDVPGFKVALDRLVGRQKMPRAAVVLGAGGGARAVVYGLIPEGFQRVIVFNRHLHRAEGMVKHFARSAAHMELRAMPWHESIIEAELAKAKVLVKIEYFSPSGSLKDRIYWNMFERAERRGALKKGMTVLECPTGNAGIGCSFVSAVRGYPCIIVMPEGMSEEFRKKLDVAYGAQMVYTSGGESDVDLGPHPQGEQADQRRQHHG